MIAVAKKRIVHLVGYAVRGGCEANCAVFIRSTPECSHQVLVLGRPGPMTVEWTELGAAVTHEYALDDSWWRFWRRLRSRFAEMAADGVLVWAGIRTPLVLAALADSGVPVVIHAGNPFVARWRVRALLAVTGLLLPRPGRVTVVACSEHTAKSFRTAPWYRDFPLSVCLNPVEVPSANPHRVRRISPDDQARLGMVARLDAIKDHRSLLKAFAWLQARWPKAELHLAGDGPLREQLTALVRDLGLDGAVHFHGSIGAVPSFLGSLDLFCYFTTECEGMGNALAEGLAHGLPCVVTDLPVLHEVAGETAAGAVRFTSPEPALVGRRIEELLLDADERRRLSAGAWRRAREVFTPRRAVERYLSFLECLP